MKKKIFTKVFSALLILMLGLTSSPVLASVVKFAQISDIHYQPEASKDENSFKLKYYALDFLDDASTEINKSKDVNFVLVTGDAADRPLSEHFEYVYKYLNKVLKPDWYYVLGNHDVAIKGSLTKQTQIQLLSKINPKGFSPEKTYYSFKPKRDYKFIGLDATYDTKVTSQGYLPPEQLKFLDNEIKNAKDDVIVIFLHHPTTYPAQSSDHNIINDFAIKKILKKYDNPILVLGGHFHSCKIVRDGNIIEVASPALVSFPNAYRMITIDNKKDKTTFTFKYCETSLKELQKLAKAKLTYGYSWVYGQETDRNAVITIDKKCKKK